MVAPRVAAFIDGFNLYHAIHDLGADHLKWINLKRLCEAFAPSPQFDLRHVLYFSAYATWLPDPYRRHREFVKAQVFVGVRPIMGNFKQKDRHCVRCGAAWKGHEEKETDVNIAIHLLREAYHDAYDRALLISNDSDLSPALRLFRAEFPKKEILLIAPPGRSYSMDLVGAVGGTAKCTKMKRIHLERSLLPGQITDPSGRVVAQRPAKYNPPPGLRPAPL